MSHSGLMLTFEARPGKEIEIEEFLETGLEAINPNNRKWYAIRVGNSSYAIIEATESHEKKDIIDEEFSNAFVSKAGHLFSNIHKVEKVKMISSKKII